MAIQTGSNPPRSRGSIRRFNLTRRHLWLGLPVFVLLWKNFLFPLPLLDFWWHLKLGEVIAATRSIPRVDVFSFTAAGKPFIVQNWLTEVVYYGLYRAGGLALIVFVNALIALAAFLAIYSLCLRATASLRTAVVVGSIAAFGFVGTIRPQTASFLIFALYYYLLSSYRLRRSNRLWTLPVLMVLWVNLHGAFLLGLILIALFIVGESCRRIAAAGTQTDALTWQELKRLIVVFLLCALVTIVNPEGYRIYDYVRTVMAYSASPVAEWQPPRVTDMSGIVLFYAPFFLGLIAFTYARRTPDLTEMTLFLAFGIFALTALRNGAWFTMVTYPILAHYLSQIDTRPLMPLRRFKIVNRFLAWLDAPSDESPSTLRMNLVVASLAVVVLIIQSPLLQGSILKNSLIQEGTPVGAVDFIQQHHLDGNIFHPQIFGDYLMWRLWPEQKSFFDGRVHIFGEDFVRKYQLVFHDSHWEDRLREWQIRYLLLSRDPAQKDSLDLIESARASGRWRTLYEDNTSILFELNAPGNN